MLDSGGQQRIWSLRDEISRMPNPDPYSRDVQNNMGPRRRMRGRESRTSSGATEGGTFGAETTSNRQQDAGKQLVALEIYDWCLNDTTPKCPLHDRRYQQVKAYELVSFWKNLRILPALRRDISKYTAQEDRQRFRSAGSTSSGPSLNLVNENRSTEYSTAHTRWDHPILGLHMKWVE